MYRLRWALRLSASLRIRNLFNRLSSRAPAMLSLTVPFSWDQPSPRRLRQVMVTICATGLEAIIR